MTEQTVVDLPEVLPYDDTHTSPAHRTHLVRPADNGHVGKSPEEGGDDPTTGQDVVDLARLTQTEVVAVCGFRFVPKHNPKRHPPCDACLDAASAVLRGERP